jgi:hypothetical protein
MRSTVRAKFLSMSARPISWRRTASVALDAVLSGFPIGRGESNAVQAVTNPFAVYVTDVPSKRVRIAHIFG